MIAVASLLIVVLLSLLVTRMATVALTVTGLSRDVARFQARSALTGSGFTTSESENVVNHPVRRRIVMLLMLVGSVGIVTLLGSLIFSFAGGVRSEQKLLRLAVIIGGLIVIWLVARSERVDRWLSRILARWLARYTDLDTRDYVRLMQLAGDFGITEMQVQDGDWLADRALGELDLFHEGVLILGIHRDGTDYHGVPRGDTVVRAGDVLVLYGRTDILADLDDRRRGPQGERAHRRAVREAEKQREEEEGREQEEDVS